MPVGISLNLSPFTIVQNITLIDLLVFLTTVDCFGSKDQFYDTKSELECKLFFFDVIDGYSDETGMNTFGLLKAPQLCGQTQISMAPVLPVSHALA